MTVHQLPVDVVMFTRWLNELVGRLRPGEGWYGEFAARDPEGMRACFEGADILPWDIVESLLHDLGETADGPRGVRGRALYEAAATAHDRAPGAASALAERRELLTREAARAEARLREPDADDAERAWVRDDLARARSRSADLGRRLARLAEATTARSPEPVTAPGHGAGPAPRRVAAPTLGYGGGAAPGYGAEPASHPAPAAPGYGAEPASHPAPAPPGSAPAPPVSPAAPPGTPAAPMSRPASHPAPAPAPRVPASPPGRRRPRGARYAWVEASSDEAEPVSVPASLVDLPVGGVAAPRGARFGGVAAGPVTAPAPAPAHEPGPDSARAAGNVVYALRRLRAQGRSGEAHALLCEALGGPPGWLPVLAAELCAAGLTADWSTLLWEAATLPPDRLAAVAGALADAGRAQDCEQLLRQGVARPVEELAGACAALQGAGREGEARALLTAFVRCRTPEDAARLAAAGPATLTPELLAAARAVSAVRERELRHALRVTGRA
ncbi:UL36 very large tegument protein [Streptomyces sp. NPDC101160]|uniref:UL36 very large tegument protein n=1 Tax=Streptomyces sp. NPDC101160 TaxID=3366118 RepID=UPI0037FDD16D